MSWFNGKSGEEEMAEARSKELHDLHNKGEQDYANGEYNRPHGFLDELKAGPEKDQQISEENKAYDAGYNNARKQR